MFAKRLKELRKAQGVSQAALAGALDISQQAVGKWETGRSTPDPQTVALIADYFGVSTDSLLGRSTTTIPAPKFTRPMGSGSAQVPILGTVRAGYGALAFEDDYGSASADVRNPEEHFYLMVKGDSMEPRIRQGDLALVRKQPNVENGELAVVIIDGEEGTLKKVIKKDGAIILQPFNSAYPTMIYMGEDLNQITIIGKVVETKTVW